MAKELVMEDWCWQVCADTNAKTMEIVWLKLANLQEAEFKAYLRTWADLVEKYQARAFLVDSRLGHLVVTPDLQTWHDQEIVTRYKVAGVEKIAFILPPDLFEATSIEQAFSEDMASKSLKTRYFEDIEEAREWLVG